MHSDFSGNTITLLSAKQDTKTVIGILLNILMAFRDTYHLNRDKFNAFD